MSAARFPSWLRPFCWFIAFTYHLYRGAFRYGRIDFLLPRCANTFIRTVFHSSIFERILRLGLRSFHPGLVFDDVLAEPFRPLDIGLDEWFTPATFGLRVSKTASCSWADTNGRLYRLVAQVFKIVHWLFANLQIGHICSSVLLNAVTFA